jgi:hypothetical protein
MTESNLSPLMVERAEQALRSVRFAVETGVRDDLRDAHVAAWNLIHIICLELAFDPDLKPWPRHPAKPSTP